MREIDNTLQAARREVQQQSDAAGYAAGEPDMAHRAGQLDVPHALAAHLGAGDLHAALIADDALETHALVFAAGAFEVLDGAENALAEKPVALGLERAVVDGLRLGNLAVGPA